MVQNKPKLTWLAKFDDFSSMGILSQRMLEQLDKTIDLSCKPIIGTTTTTNPLIHSYLNKQSPNELGIMFAYPDSVGHLSDFKTKVIYTGVDTTGEAGNFVTNGNKADFFLTPSNISKNRIKNMGITKPIFVVPHGIDPKIFNYTPRIKGDKFKFLYIGECSDRKGIFHTLEAFINLFKNNNNVELHIKSNSDMLFYNSQDVKNIIEKHNNIFWHISDDGHDKVMDLYRNCHAYVYPSRGDSFGMTLLEAIACGLPTISTSEPGATELIRGKYYNVSTKSIPVKNHPWFLGNWGEPNLKDLIKHMKHIYDNYDLIVKSGVLKENSDYIIKNYSWEKIASNFENDVLPKLTQPTQPIKVLTLLTSFNRPNHIKNIINSLKDIQEPSIINTIYIVENSDQKNKEEILQVINKNINSKFIVYNSEFNLGQRGSLLHVLDNINLDDYDFIQFTDQDNIFKEPISTYCTLLNTYPDKYVATGYMSKEHTEINWITTKFGNLVDKFTCRAGHMVMRTKDIKNMMPIYLDSQHNEPRVNSSWNAGLDWELTHWHPKSPGQLCLPDPKPFIICVPGAVIHKGIDSTFQIWPVEENEYTLEELKELRKNKF
jgi:glycosyltransferase involved in cell wall biosynthesis